MSGCPPSTLPTTPESYANYWNVMSYLTTPALLQQRLSRKNRDQEPYLAPSFVACKARVFLQMFSSVLDRVQRMLSHGVSSKTVWEQYLAKEGFIPACVPRETVTNHRFGYVPKGQNHWEEWAVVSVQIMRLYWENMFEGLPHSVTSQLRLICMALISTLPGPSEQCHLCRWKVPASSMHALSEKYPEKQICVYCHTRQKYPERCLGVHRGIPLLKLGRPARHLQSTNSNSPKPKVSCGTEARLCLHHTNSIIISSSSNTTKL